MADEALPSGNAVAALALGRLGYLLGETRYLDATEATLRTAWSATVEYPHGHATMLAALDEFVAPPEIVVVRAPACQLAEWLTVAGLVFAPRRLVFGIPADTGPLPSALAARQAGAAPLAYVCRGVSCGPPVHSVAELGTALAGNA